MKSNRKDGEKPLAGALGVALAAALCCLGPLVLVSLGVTGAWIGTLSALEAYRPVFMVAAVFLLGLAFYRVYGRSRPTRCEGETGCGVPAVSKTDRISIWTATVVVVGLFASPYLLSVAPDVNSGTANGEVLVAAEAATVSLSTATLTVQEMTCEGCTHSVKTALKDIDGVKDARVTFEPPEARVIYDRSKVTIEELASATAAIGYPSTPQR